MVGKQVFAVLSALLLSFAGTVFADDPSAGDEAHYTLNRDRSSSFISSGSIDTILGDILDPQADPIKRSLHVGYEIKLILMGGESGETDIALEETIVNGLLLEDLRELGEIETQDYKLRHDGFVTLEQQGIMYPDVDKVFIYDIALEQDNRLAQVIVGLLDQLTVSDPRLPSVAGISNVEVDAYFKREMVPSLGVVRVDIRGKYSGIRFRAGFDFIP